MHYIDLSTVLFTDRCTLIMTEDTQNEKESQFNEFFTIEHRFNINAKKLEQVPTFEEFLADMPLPFKLASDMVSLDSAALRPLNQLDAVASLLVEYLNHQSKKIDLLLGFVLSQQDNEAHRYRGIRFGGGGIEFSSTEEFTSGQFIELKIFFPEQNVAIYCIGEVFAASKSESEKYQHKVILHHIRDDDRELLVRTSLHLQSKQLQSLAAKRRKE